MDDRGNERIVIVVRRKDAQRLEQGDFPALAVCNAAARALREQPTATVIVRRAKSDRGTIVVNGERSKPDIDIGERRNICCGRSGYVAYCFEFIEHSDGTSSSDPDDAFECIWCGATTTRRDGFGWEAWEEMQGRRKSRRGDRLEDRR